MILRHSQLNLLAVGFFFVPQSNFNRKSDRELISHSLVWAAYLTIYGNEASQQQNNQRLATAYQCIGEYSLVDMKVVPFPEGSGMRP